MESNARARRTQRRQRERLFARNQAAETIAHAQRRADQLTTDNQRRTFWRRLTRLAKQAAASAAEGANHDVA